MPETCFRRSSRIRLCTTTTPTSARAEIGDGLFSFSEQRRPLKTVVVSVLSRFPARTVYAQTSVRRTRGLYTRVAAPRRCECGFAQETFTPTRADRVCRSRQIIAEHHVLFLVVIFFISPAIRREPGGSKSPAVYRGARATAETDTAGVLVYRVRGNGRRGRFTRARIPHPRPGGERVR